MRKVGLSAVSLLMFGVSACEPTPAVPPPQPTAVAVTPPVVQTAAPTGPDLTAVTEPADIVGVARWRSPIATVSNLASCAGVAPIIVEVNARMGVDQVLRQVLRSSFDTRKLAGLVALDAPVDLVVALDPQPRMKPPLVAVSVGLSSLDGAKVAISPEGSPAELVPGVWKLKGERGVACAVAASAGQTPARLVCSEREKSLQLLAPYMARTMPGLDLGGPDLHAEARVDVLRKRYGEGLTTFLATLPGAVSAEYGIGEPRFDRLLFESATSGQQDAGRLLADLGKITVDAKTERSGSCLRASADVDLTGKSSWIAQTFTDRLDRAGAPPAIYWRQPKDAEIALYGRGLDAAHFSPIVTRARELLDAALASENFGSAADRKKIAELLELPYGKDTTTVWSHGSVNVALPEATSKAAQAKLAEAAFTRFLGWTLIGVDEGPAAMKKRLKALVDTYKLAGVQAGLKKELGPSDAKMLPVVKAGTAPATLGANAEAIELTIPNVELPPPPDSPDGKSPGKVSLKVHVLLMADGDATWIAFGASKDELVKRLLAAKTGASDKEQLAARAGLDSLRNSKQMLGGFVSAAAAGQKVSALILSTAGLVPGAYSSDEVKLAQSLLNLPNRGTTPLFITGTGTPGATPRLTLSVEAQQGTFEDAKALVVSSYGFFSSMGLLP